MIKSLVFTKNDSMVDFLAKIMVSTNGCLALEKPVPQQYLLPNQLPTNSTLGQDYADW